MNFTPEEDKILYQGAALLGKYVGGHGTRWSMIKALLPERTDVTIKKRSILLETKMKSEITQFLISFESRYGGARREGTVKEIKAGPAFDLRYYLNWYNSKVSEDTVQPPTAQKYLKR